MKKAVGIISLALCAVFVQPANATDEKVIAIIDTAINSSKFSNIIYEVCFTGNGTCPNKTVFQEGIGSANVDRWDAVGIGHGHSVVDSAVKSNQNAKIVFIRIANIAPGSKLPMAYSEGKSLEKAIDWLSKNAQKYSIDLVSISGANTNFPKGTCPKNEIFEKSVKALTELNVAVFAGTGNNGFKNSIGFPACVTGVFPVGAVDSNNSISSFSNITGSVKIFANKCIEYKGATCVKTPDFAGIMRQFEGTSASSPIAAAKLLGLWNGEEWKTFIESFPKTNGFTIVK